MEPDKLRIFESAARRGGFAGAARELFISRSSASRAVSALESELAVTLVTRSGNAMTGLTLAGEALLAGAGELLDKHDALVAAVRAAAETDTKREKNT